MLGGQEHISPGFSSEERCSDVNVAPRTATRSHSWCSLQAPGVAAGPLGRLPRPARPRVHPCLALAPRALRASGKGGPKPARARRLLSVPGLRLGVRRASSGATTRAGPGRGERLPETSSPRHRRSALGGGCCLGREKTRCLHLPIRALAVPLTAFRQRLTYSRQQCSGAAVSTALNSSVARGSQGLPPPLRHDRSKPLHPAPIPGRPGAFLSSWSTSTAHNELGSRPGDPTSPPGPPSCVRTPPARGQGSCCAPPEPTALPTRSSLWTLHRAPKFLRKS